MQLLTLVGMLITIASVIFATANTTEVTVMVLGSSFTGPLGVLLLVALLNVMHRTGRAPIAGFG